MVNPSRRHYAINGVVAILAAVKIWQMTNGKTPPSSAPPPAGTPFSKVKPTRTQAEHPGDVGKSTPSSTPSRLPFEWASY